MRTVRLMEAEDVVVAAAATRDALAAGAVIVVPTETFYGLAVDPECERAVAAVCEMKGRPRGVALPVLCADWDQADNLVEVPDRYRVRLSRTWPGPVTAVMPARRPLPAGRGSTLAVRIPGHGLLRALLYLVGPMTGTSANRHGAPPPTTAGDAVIALDPPPALVLDGGPTVGGKPSTVVDLTGPEAKVLRPGAVSWS